MGTLNPNIPAPDLTQALHDAARSLPVYGRRVLTPELLLLTFVRGRELPAYRLLERMSRERGFKLFLASNVLWVVWGVGAAAWAVVALQFVLAALNLRGARKAEHVAEHEESSPAA